MQTVTEADEWCDRAAIIRTFTGRSVSMRRSGATVLNPTLTVPVCRPMRALFPRLGIVLATVGLAVGLSGCVAPQTNVGIDSGASCPSGKTFCYKPASVSVASGTKVVWKNNTAIQHTVSRCTMPACPVSGGTGTDTGFGSGTIAGGGTYQFVFHHKGTYVYYCKIHGYAVMHGTVTVT